MSSRKPQGHWTNNLVASQSIYTPAVKIEINLANGHQPYQRWKKLRNMIIEIIYNYKQELMHQYAITLKDWIKSLDFAAPGRRADNPARWVLELEPEEWQALSRGLRELGTPAGSSMYQWLSQHKVEDHGD